jgi:hypothetical protein
MPLRLHKYDLSALASYYETLSSPKNDTIPSLRFKTSYTQTSLANGHWSRLEHTTWTVGIIGGCKGLWLTISAIKGPFSYEALPPEQIEFIPLNQTKKMNGKELMEFYDV